MVKRKRKSKKQKGGRLPFMGFINGIQKASSMLSKVQHKYNQIKKLATSRPPSRQQRGSGIKDLLKSFVTGKTETGEILGFLGSGTSLSKYKKKRKNEVLYNRIAPKLSRLRSMSNNLVSHAIRKGTKNHPTMERMLNNQWNTLSQSFADVAFKKAKRKVMSAK
jgi:hypothetical protein